MGYFLDRAKSLTKDEGSKAKTESGCEVNRPKLVEGPPQWHAETIAQAVQREGVCVLWSELFGEIIAFIKDDSFKSRVPCGIVAYTSQELLELSRKDLSEAAHRLIHEAKKAGGGRIINHEPKG